MARQVCVEVGHEPVGNGLLALVYLRFASVEHDQYNQQPDDHQPPEDDAGNPNRQYLAGVGPR